MVEKVLLLVRRRFGGGCSKRHRRRAGGKCEYALLVHCREDLGIWTLRLARRVAGTLETIAAARCYDGEGGREKQ